MTLSKIALSVVALGFSFGPALADGDDAFARLISPTAQTRTASLVEGRQATTIATRAPTDSERYVIDRNAMESHGR